MARRQVPTALAAAAVLIATSSPVTAQPPAGPAAITVEPGQVGSVQEPGGTVTRELTIGNAGDADLRWRVVEETGGPQPPVRPVTPVGTVAAPEPGGATFLPYPGFRGRRGWTVELEPPAVPEGELTFTHSGATAVVAGGAVACSRHRGVTTTASGYLRHFPLADFGITGDLQVTAVSFGVESVVGAVRPLTVNLFTLADPDGLLVYDNLTPVGTATATVGPLRMSMVEVPVAGTVPAGATLVVEVAVPDLSRGGFFIGTHPAGQSAPSYLRAQACGVPEPVPTAALGFPDLQMLLNVTGVAEVPPCQVPAETPWAAVSPRSGTVAPGGAQPVDVTLDATGLAVGEHRALLCLDSDDPARPRVQVPVALRVCDRVVAGTHPGPLTVTGGVTCLAPGAQVEGALNVFDRAGLVATSVTVQGPLATFGAVTAELTDSQVVGPVSVRGTTGRVALTGTRVIGSVLVSHNRTGDRPIVVSGNTIIGSLFCTGNRPPPADGGVPNTVVGGMKLDQCAGL